MGCALPQASTADQALPFKPAPLGSGRSCPGRTGGYDEADCGTKRYCKAIEAFGSDSDKFKTKPAWNSTAECFKAHQPEPKQELIPFDTGRSFDADCRNRGLTEASCGTKTYCAEIDAIEEFYGLHGEDTEQTEDVRYESTEECLKAHVPEPKNLPWLEGDSENFCGSRGDESEENCGTQSYCEKFKGDTRKVFGSPYIWSEEECFAAHQKNPSSITFPDN